jgi:hypothetical protein
MATPNVRQPLVHDRSYHAFRAKTLAAYSEAAAFATHREDASGMRG